MIYLRLLLLQSRVMLPIIWTEQYRDCYRFVGTPSLLLSPLIYRSAREKITIKPFFITISGCFRQLAFIRKACKKPRVRRIFIGALLICPLFQRKRRDWKLKTSDCGFCAIVKRYERKLMAKYASTHWAMIYVYPTFIAPDMIVIATEKTRAMFPRQCFAADASALHDETVKHVIDISEYLAILQSSRSIQAGCTGNKSFLSYRKGKFGKAFYFSSRFIH